MRIFRVALALNCPKIALRRFRDEVYARILPAKIFAKRKFIPEPNVF